MTWRAAHNREIRSFSSLIQSMDTKFDLFIFFTIQWDRSVTDLRPEKNEKIWHFDGS